MKKRNEEEKKEEKRRGEKEREKRRGESIRVDVRILYFIFYHVLSKKRKLIISLHSICSICSVVYSCSVVLCSV